MPMIDLIFFLYVNMSMVFLNSLDDFLLHEMYVLLTIVTKLDWVLL